MQFRSTREIDEHINFWKNEFRKFFPEYKDLPIIGCVCALKFGKGVDTYGIKQGLYCFKPIKGIMGILTQRTSGSNCFKIYLIRKGNTEWS